MTPLQVGNGDFAFGADITGLQTFSRFSIQSSWAWHNFSLPTVENQTSPSDFLGVDWWTYDRLVNYNMPNPAESDISNWLVQNPQRLNMANTGFHFYEYGITEENILNKSQYLDLWEGTIISSFNYKESDVSVQVSCHPDQPVVGIAIKTDLVLSSKLGIFLEFPNFDTHKFDAPYVGVWNDTSHSTVTMRIAGNTATFHHKLDNNFNQVGMTWNTDIDMSLNRLNGGSDTLHIVADFSPPNTPRVIPDYNAIVEEYRRWWENYWTSGAFIDLSAARNSSANELQRRIILSQYLVAVNEASYNPPQGLVNNGWYGKFHVSPAVNWSTTALSGQSLETLAAAGKHTEFTPIAYSPSSNQILGHF
ncbi:uncharacterized protein N7469_010942 [Penicillium citrinum]|uniref:Uncharacterized protein n=1 Tax=Penicillium citrinum TaxID=5077 RepID=A0A9W9NLB7_PENCI|nr:uncharacterized protein N7469_010942 [Penicillium citrinum]KAJ5222055.1 hypothetical protein N7469_010942 [Penicillium citrinum]